MRTKNLTTILLTALITLTSLVPLIGLVSALNPIPMLLNPKTIPKYVNQLTGPPPVYDPVVVINGTGHVIGYNYTVFMDEFRQKILPTGTPLVQIVGEPWYNDGKTWVWGYNGSAKDALTGAPLGYVANSPSATFEATRGIPTNVTWVNRIDTAHMFAVDPTLHWANPNNFPMPGMGMGMPPVTAPIYPPGYPEAQFPVPLIPHLHGGEVQSTSDGHPEAWFLYNGTHGPAYNSANVTSIPYPNAAVFHYPNMQPPTTLWYHDHALGITRINVMSGLAGFYILRGNLTDPLNPYYDNIEANYLPPANYEMPLVIQDRMFKANGEFWFPNNGLNPTVHPYWLPEFFGDTIMVNGLVWPNLYVEPRQYRFRLLDGSNARFYTLSLTYANKGTTLPFTQIGGDGGYLPAPVTLKELTIAPGERADILIDFSALPAGTKLILKNTAKAPFPGGAPVDPQTTGQVMQFTVTAGAPVTPTPLPATLITMPTLTTNAPARMLTLTEVMGPAGPVEILLDGQKWAAPISETPKVGSTEDWIIINPTADTHPIHLHLVQFEVISRQSFQVNKYMKDWIALNGMPPLLNPTVNVPSITPYLSGKPQAPAANEKGWKDTVQAPTGMVTIIRVRYAPLDSPTTVTPGTNLYPFDPTVGPGYVWHCHILDHEDNEMMRPYLVKT